MEKIKVCSKCKWTILNQFKLITKCTVCWYKSSFTKNKYEVNKFLDVLNLEYYDLIKSKLWDNFRVIIQSFGNEWVIFTNRKYDKWNALSSKLWRTKRQTWWKQIDKAIGFPLSVSFNNKSPLEWDIAYTLIATFYSGLDNIRKKSNNFWYSSNTWKYDESLYKKLYRFLLIYWWVLSDPMRFMEEEEDKMEDLEEYMITNNEIINLSENTEIDKKDIPNIIRLCNEKIQDVEISWKIYNQWKRSKKFNF